ncbi:MAG: glycoside hydrolase family 3 C-terminal domain-containing protein [Bacteroidales bacterium]|nr:glycoside hydrolase family 3 C-terminal domain-containing protein [Bacteroidales bacterium]
MKKLPLLLCLLFTGLAATLLAQLPYTNPALSHEARAQDLLNRLTLEEKVALMQDQSPSVPRLGVPEFGWWNEALHGVARSGYATVFPQAIGMAATFDEDAVFRTFTAVSDEARAKATHSKQVEGRRGKYRNLSFWTPNINIFRDPRWGRGQETYGEDPYLTTRLGVAVVKGLQGPDDSHYAKAMACAKHYAVHSGPEWNRHSFDAKNILPEDLWETYLPAFRALVQEANVKQVMCAYNRYEGDPCCGSDRLLVNILREGWNYQHVVVSDCGAIDDFYKEGRHETHPDSASASSAAVRSGTDLECGRSYKSLIEAVNKGLIAESELDLSLKRLLKARFELGDFDPDSLVPWTRIPMSVVNCEAHQQLALEMARKSLVLLKNDKNVLPLPKKADGLLVMGPNADNESMQWGNYNGTPYNTITILQGLETAVGSKLPFIRTPHVVAEEMVQATIDSLMASLPACDKVLFVGGISPKLEGEQMRVNLPGFKGGDRTSIELPTVQRALVNALARAGKQIVFINCSGSAMGLSEEANTCDAILQAWYPGEKGGQAVAEVLFGDYNPSGRLPLTFYAGDHQLPDYEDYSMKGRTYRFLEEEPLYPFGHGLSYTSFAYSKPKVKKGTKTLSVRVTNTGKRSGEEIVQLYVQRTAPQARAKALRGFQRVNLKPGESKIVRFSLDDSTLAFFDSNQGIVSTLPGSYLLEAGGSSASTTCVRTTYNY